MKKFLSILLAAMMLLATAGVAFAETVEYPNAPSDSNSLVTNVSDHTFHYFQIFAGDQEADSNILSNVTWGSDVTGEIATAILNEIVAKYSDKFTGITATSTAADLAKVLGESTDKLALGEVLADILHDQFAEKTGKVLPKEGSVTMDPGYYLIVDKTELTGEDDFFNTSLLQVTGEGNLTVKVKTDKPYIEKKVKEIGLDDSLESTTYGADMNDTADYSIGDTVEFKLYSKAPNMSNYDVYQYIIHDTMSKGLTLDATSIVVNIGTQSYTSANLPAGMTITTATNSAGETTIEIAVENLKVLATAGDEITVTYNAELNSDAVIGNPGNPNNVYLEYSNNPNDGGEGTTNSKKDYVVVFTYELDITKTDADTDEQLDNAVFYLYKKDGDNYKFAILDDDNKVTGWTDAIAPADIAYSETDEGELVNPANATKIVTAAETPSVVIGLEDGTYYLLETKTPTADYNMPAAAFDVEIEADIDDYYDTWDGNTDALITLKVNSVEGDTDAGKVAMTIENGKGAVLPETGGIGTTLFYLIGGLMAAGSALTLVIRRRADADEE